MVCCDELEVGDELVTVSTTTIVVGTDVDICAGVGVVVAWLVVVVAGLLAGVCSAEYP